MDEETKKEIEEIIGQMKCSKDFQCYRFGFEKVCKAREIGVESFLDCLEEKPLGCKFSMLFGDTYMCQCPLRVYIAKKLKK